MTDKTPLIHAAVSVAIQIAVGFASGDWLSGGIAACIWFIAREHTQAEYRWIEKFGNGLRKNMPQWGGFDYRVWNTASALDFIAPVIACAGIYYIQGQL